MSDNKDKNKPTGKTAMDYLKALRKAEELLDKGVMPWILLGQTAKQVREGSLHDIQKIEIGILRKDLGEFTENMLKTFGGKEWQKFEAEGVPIEIRIIEKKYGFFNYPDKVWYYGTQFLTPNPFDKYWKMRNLIA